MPASPWPAVTPPPTASPRSTSSSTRVAQDWQQFHREVIDSLHAEPGAEARLADRIAELMWRIRRVAVAEAEFVDRDYMNDEQAQKRDEWMKENSRRVRDAAPAAPPAPKPTALTADIARFLDETGPSPQPVAPADQPVTGFYAPVFAAESRFPPLLPARTIPDAAHTERIIRYEAHLSRQLYLALNQLEAMQNRRAGQSAPIARVQITGLAST